METYYKIIASPVGKLTLVVSDSGLQAVLFAGDCRASEAKKIAAHPILDKAERQLAEYFSGKRREFNIPLDPQGTPFQLKAWRELSKIPYGETISYSEQARRMGNVRQARPVGQANGKNPISIIVPCHRVIGASGKLTGYGGGMGKKQFLLDLEQRQALRQAA